MDAELIGSLDDDIFWIINYEPVVYLYTPARGDLERREK